MSADLEAIIWRWRMPPPEKLVLVRLATQANNDGVGVMPSVDLLASLCGLGPELVSTSLWTLMETGILEAEEPGGWFAINTENFIEPKPQWVGSGSSNEDCERRWRGVVGQIGKG